MKRLIITIASISILSGLVVGGVMANGTTADPTPPPDLTPTVQAQQTELDNHEARITNTEGDVKVLQSNTKTAPAPTRVEVPAVTPAPTPDPQPTVVKEVTVIKSSLYMDVSGNAWCNVNYSDGTNDKLPSHPTTKTNPDGSTSSDDHCQDYLGQVK